MKLFPLVSWLWGSVALQSVRSLTSAVPLLSNGEAAPFSGFPLLANKRPHETISLQSNVSRDPFLSNQKRSPGLPRSHFLPIKPSARNHFFPIKTVSPFARPMKSRSGFSFPYRAEVEKPLSCKHRYNIQLVVSRSGQSGYEAPLVSLCTNYRIREEGSRPDLWLQQQQQFVLL